MPIYEYQCPTCGHVFERIMKVGEEDPACPACRVKEVKKQSSAFRTNGWSTFLDHMEKQVSSGKFK
jgi:putative FmdB family regulatory protein